MKKCKKLAEAKLNGFVRYFTGRPCKKGHVCERLVSDRSCVICNAEKAQAKRDAMSPEEKYKRGLKYRHLKDKWLQTEKGRNSRSDTLRKYYQNNQQALAEYRKAYNLKTNNFHSKQWKKEHPAVRLAWSAKRRADRIQRTPPWLTTIHKKEIGMLYWEAAELSKLVGEFYHVDHIEPLRGADVCGLHVPWNLQILTAKQNLSKGNRVQRN
jgi:hypothetical protein